MRNTLLFARRILIFPSKIINSLQIKAAGINTKKLKINGYILIQNSGNISIGEHTKINSSKYWNIIGGDTRTSIVVHKGAVLTIGKCQHLELCNTVYYIYFNW